LKHAPRLPGNGITLEAEPGGPGHCPGRLVADTRHPALVWEIPYYPAYYLPLSDIRTDLLTPSATQTHCPYKGTAAYWSAGTGHGTHRDLVWAYRAPLPESQNVAGLACFCDEETDVYLDGELQERPRMHFA
jgi:uncharacterized protein (DUF427 family)